MNADVNHAIQNIIKGANAPITVTEKKYTTQMSAQALNDQQITDVLRYVYVSGDNSKKVVTPEMVKAQKKNNQNSLDEL